MGKNRLTQIDGLSTTFQNSQVMKTNKQQKKDWKKKKNTCHWKVETGYMATKCNVTSLTGFWERKKRQ